MNALESLYQAVEATCNSDEGLLRLVQALLEHQPRFSSSSAVRDYVGALIYYAFHSRRRTIWLQADKLLQSPCGINSGYGPFIDWQLARDYARGPALAEVSKELSPEEIQDIKNRVGRLRLGSILARIRDMHYEVPQ